MRLACRRFCLLSWVPLAWALVACGGSSNSSPPPVTVPALQLNDDAASAATGRDAVIDVLANDPGAAGLTLTAVTGQGQATLSIEGNTVRYRPRCCDLAADEFRYTARNAAGQTASATVRVSVEKRLSLRGRVADLGPRYELRLFSGADDGVLQATTSEDFALDIPSRDDGDVVRLEARRLDTANLPLMRDRLLSILGSWAELKHAAGVDGELSFEERDALRVSSLSTAWLGVMREENGGDLPTNATPWSEWQARAIDVENVLQRAQLVKLALDTPDLALPVADTFELASSGSAVIEVLATQTLDPAARADLFGPASRPDFPVPPATFWLYRAGLVQDEVAARAELTGDGSGRVVGPNEPVSVNWTRESGTLSVRASNVSVLRFGDVPLLSPFCTLGSPVGRRADRYLIDRLDLRALSLTGSSALPDAAAPDAYGLETTGPSHSSCGPLIAPVSLSAGLGLSVGEQPRGLTVPDGILGGRWVLPRSAGRPSRAGRIFLDSNRQGRGLFEEDAGVVGSAQVQGGVLRMSTAEGEALAYPVAGETDAWRVVVAFPGPEGERVSQAWVVREDASLRLADLWRGKTLRDCCRRGVVNDLSMNAQGEIAGPNFTIAAQREELDGRRIVIELSQNGPQPPARLSFTALRRLSDGRVLLLTRFDDDYQNEIDDEWPVVDLVRFE